MRSRSCSLLLLLLLLPRCNREHPAPAASTVAPPIIVISIDTLRSDHLPAYGYTAGKTPNIDALRADSILFQHAWSHVPLTLPSHVSILTGLLPQEHGVRNNLGYRYDSAAHPAIPQILKRRGYATGAAVSAYVLRGETGLRSAFDFYDDAISQTEGAALADLQRPGATTEAIAESWITKNSALPFFFFLHLFEPHAPYTPSPAHSGFANPYDGEIAEADAVVGRFIDYLKRSGIYDRAVIVLLSDHGEGLNDHGEEEHGIFLYREAIQVPLLLKLPRQDRRGSSVARAVQLIDVAPTLAVLAGTESTGKGLSLLTTDAKPRSIYSETFYPRIHLGWSELRSLVDDAHHYIEAPRAELYDLNADAAEKNNLLSSERRIYASMKKELSNYDATLAKPSNVTPEESARLTSLGYLGSPGSAAAGALPDPKDEIGKVRPMQQAARLAAEGKSAEAVSAWRAILRENPGLVAAWSALATELEMEGHLPEAVETWGEAMRSVPQIAPNMALSRGAILLRMGRVDEAERDARMAAALNPSAAHQLLARVAMARRDLPGAEKESRLAMDDPSLRLQASLTLAQALAAQGRREEALGVLDQSLAEARERGTAVPFLQFGRGDVLMTLGRTAEAQQAFREEIRLYPNRLRAYTNLAAIQLLAQDPAGASALVEQMVKANPGREAMLMAAHFYQSLGDSASAATWRSRAGM